MAVIAGLLRPLRARHPAQPRAGGRAGAAVRPQRLAARGAGAPGRAGAHARPRVRLGELPLARDAAGRDPEERPAAAHARDPRALQQRLALVPPERDRRPRPHRRVLHRPQPRADRRRARSARAPAGPRHELLRALLRRARRSRPALLARARRRGRRVLDPVGRAATDRASRQFIGGRAELRALHRRRRHERLGAPRAARRPRGRRRVRARRDALRQRRADRDLPRRRAAGRRRADGALHGRAVAGDRVRRRRRVDAG